MSLRPLYLFFSAWLLGFAEGHGCLESGVYIVAGNFAQGNQPTKQECAKWCRNVQGCIAWTYHTEMAHCWLKSNDDKKISSPWVTGTKTCDALDMCVDKCSKEVCSPDVDEENGCNQMYSCAQACKIRDLGISRRRCKRECDRTGQSGCSPVVSGFQFALCGPCNRSGCNRWPTIEECEAGCSFYDD